MPQVSRQVNEAASSGVVRLTGFDASVPGPAISVRPLPPWAWRELTPVPLLSCRSHRTGSRALPGGPLLHRRHCSL